MKKYKDSGAADEFKQKKKQAEKDRKAAEKKTKAPAASKKAKNTSGTGSSGKFTSKEYIEDDDSSSDSDKEKDKKKKDSKDVSLPLNYNFSNISSRWQYLWPDNYSFSVIIGEERR